MRFLLQFRGLHNDLRLAEFLAALSTVRNVPEAALDVSLTPAYSRLTATPTPPNPRRGHAGAVLYGEIFFYADLHSEAEAVAVAARSVLLRAVYVPVGHGRDYAECVASVDKPPFLGALSALRDPRPAQSFRCYVDAFGSSVSVPRQLDKIHTFSHVLRTLPGVVRMAGADHELWILEDAFPVLGHGRRSEAPDTPRQVFLARRVATGDGRVRADFSLKKRAYIGPTSMDAELAFVMAGMARVRPGTLVCDPFCGTGGVLVACAARGAHVVAADINLLALRGKSNTQTLAANFAQYGLHAPIGVCRADVMHGAFRRGKMGLFDAVVCDPPYGIKEGTRVFREDRIDEGMQENHFQGTRRVRFVDFLRGVLEYAAHVLVEDGRLVYWLPTTPEYREEDVPTHPFLELLHNNVQPITTRMSRRLITMRRRSDRDGERNAQRIEEERLRRRAASNGADRAGADGRVPAHFDLACKLLRQPERAERLLPRRNAPPVDSANGRGICTDEGSGPDA